MGKINLRSGYKINQSKHKRYIEHYHIPASECLVVPVRSFGEDSQCEVRWEDEYGQLHQIDRLVFKTDNLIPLNPLLDIKLLEIWDHYYGQN